MSDELYRTPDDVLAAFDRDWFSEQKQTFEDFIFLTSCATTDITQPYHSLSYLTAVLSAAGEKSATRDLGIEFWHYVISEPVIAELACECETRAATANDETQNHLLLFLRLLSKPDRFRHAFDTLRDPELFYELKSYIEAVGELSRLPRLLTLLSQESDIRTFASASPPGYQTDHIDLAALANGVKQGLGAPILDHFYDHHADLIAELKPVFAGFTVPFLSQLEHMLLLGWKLKQRGIKVVIGGPIAAKFVKYARRITDLRELSFAIDLIVTGEGETLIVDLARRLKAGETTDGLANLISTHDPKFPSAIHFENIDRLPAPDFSIWDYSLYASPKPGALYSPTRGCYWNKCAFCDYGLAVDGPTSPWRTRSPEHVVEDLRAASPHVKRFFFAVDVLSPSYALKLSRAIIEHQLDLLWMADFRLENTFDERNVPIFCEAGCLGAAFGMESADQAILDHIDKGTDSDRLSKIVNAFADAGVPVQLMGFTGFPGETAEQARTTFSKAKELLDKAATAAIGKYGLSKGSFVAKNPDSYGVEILSDGPDCPSIHWDIKWRHKEMIDVYPQDDFTDSLSLLRGFAYPFLGATSTLHSLLYFERYPKAPFPLPAWSHDNLPPGPFYALPLFFMTPGENPDQIIVESGLTGRLLVISPEVGELLNSLFPEMAWSRFSGNIEKQESELEILRFLTEHSLALFLSEGVQIES
ncbi:MAG: radical SAM protein [Candidatus Thiodiazotropha endolucinida]